jgi:hypothetical protein
LVNRQGARLFLLLLLIMLLILLGHVVSRKDHEQDQDHEQEVQDQAPTLSLGNFSPY